MAGVDFERELNDEQRAAALAPDGPVLVIAAAGTGKTRTLTYRVAHLVERGVDPARILLLTFTNRAAREMLERAGRLVGDRVGGIWGGTFHHMANRMLRRHAGRIGWPNDFKILDEDDSRSIVRAVLRDLDLRDKRFPKPEALLSVLGLAVSRDVPPDELVAKRFADTEVRVADVLRVFREYAERKRALNAMDFDDLLAQARRLLQECAPVRQNYQEQFLHVLVDEYQDTNPIQAALVDLLAARHRNLLVVGDDFQSIYSWRGADYRNFLSFPERYPDARTYKLETNYRSVPGVLAVANECIAGNPHQFQKTLRPVRKDPIRPQRIELRDGRQQARFVADEIERLLQKGFPPREIAVLYRAHFHALEMELELQQRAVPFAMTSGLRFFEQAHVKDVCAVLRLAYAPGDELAFVRMLSLLPRVAERGAERIWKNIGARFNPLSTEEGRAVGKQLPEPAREPWARIVEKLAQAVEKPHPSALAGEIVSRFCDAFYREYVSLTFQDAEERMQDLQALIEFTERFPSLGEFLDEVTLLTNVDTGPRPRRGEERQDRVLLSTIHQAKGLEWRAVFVLWLADGLFPAGRALVEDPLAEEERRLFYVAVTRAKDRLYLCAPRMRMGKDYGMQFYSPSRFLEEIPPQLVERRKLAEGGYDPGFGRGWMEYGARGGKRGGGGGRGYY